jgi:hypothetical protein
VIGKFSGLAKTELKAHDQPIAFGSSAQLERLQVKRLSWCGQVFKVRKVDAIDSRLKIED